MKLAQTAANAAREALRAAPGAAKAIARAGIAWAIVTGAFAAVHLACGRVLAQRDLVAALVVRHDAGLAAVAAALVVARTFLFFFAPAWALHVVVRTLLLRRQDDRK
jgi:hypothetical protein